MSHNLAKLTIKQRIFLQEYFKTGNGVRSAMKAYDTKDYQSAAAIASENLNKLKPTVAQLMEAKGLALGDLIDVLVEAKKADRWNDFTGEREADYNARLKAVSIASKWLGLEQQQIPNVAVQVNTIIATKKDEYGL